ncbi:hypothetical protein [Mycobacteroides abscessus]|uniref:hypothetical protein n=1 Tax=Mycobacteroides abscessus TaxID=36809 RepID=UPI00092BA3BF|nr:hypothetical protein [Mycobacteroides abscessus]SHQ49436.1 Uncharacterised protein [Mycobacteroides abscessus subsp. abscessus]SKQ84408.1 Uncharacterised protein [Mycobacteroides abscessus subsp. massiliense]SLC49427.1 Uncharacterised protein [Mycobacteroides abscessus subsp. massiliense]
MEARAGWRPELGLARCWALPLAAAQVVVRMAPVLLDRPGFQSQRLCRSLSTYGRHQ